MKAETVAYTYNSAAEPTASVLKSKLIFRLRYMVSLYYYFTYIASYLLYYKPKSLLAGPRQGQLVERFEAYNRLFFGRPDYAYFKADEGRLFYEARDYIQDPSLEIGYEDGLIASMHTGNHMFDVGMEHDPGVLGKTPAVNHYGKLMQGSLEQIPLPDDSFKSIVTIHVLDHVVDVEPCIAELARVCMPGGHVLFSLFSARVLELYRKEYLETKYFHFNFLTREQWQALLARHGLELVKLEEFTCHRNWLKHLYFGMSTSVCHNDRLSLGFFHRLGIRSPMWLRRFAATLFQDIIRCTYLDAYLLDSNGRTGKGYNFFILARKRAYD